MKTKLTVIVDNKPSEKLAGEWGLSIMVEYGEMKLLVDVGASDLFATNLEKLGFDIRDVDYATLSHAHYDHSNGMPRFFRENQKAKFYVQKATAPNCYKKVGYIFHKYIGIPKKVLEEYPERIVKVQGDYQICDGVWLIPHKTPGLEAIGRREKMYQKTKAGWKPDDFSHEQSLVLETDKGLVIINCCSHGGALNVIREVRETFPGKQVYGLIGGFHLYNKSEEEVRQVAKSLQETELGLICTGHCTMDKACGIMKEILGDKFETLQVGLEMKF